MTTVTHLLIGVGRLRGRAAGALGHRRRPGQRAGRGDSLQADEKLAPAPTVRGIGFLPGSGRRNTRNTGRDSRPRVDLGRSHPASNTKRQISSEGDCGGLPLDVSYVHLPSVS